MIKFYDDDKSFKIKLGKGSKKKSIMEKSSLGGGVSEGHFPYPIF